jgi:two-component system, cell cycle sensor histidine kinase and response regulator CckA
MNQTDVIIITISGLLQLSVALYCWRLTRMFGVVKVGWSLASAFALLALVHLIEAVDRFSNSKEFGFKIEIIYACVSFLLLASLAHLEAMLKERQRLERQARKLQTIGQLAEGITHDFNNIVTSIESYVGLLLLKQHDAETTESLHQIEEAVNRAGALTRQLLAFGRGHSAQLELLDLHVVIGNTVQMLRRLLGSAIQLESIPVPNLPDIVGDVNLIQEIIVSLAVNARDAMPKGGTLTIEAAAVSLDKAQAACHREGRAGDFICVRVSDTGDGMSPELLARIFEPFFTGKEAAKGAGPGLATVQRIARQHSGWAEAHSVVGKGTEVAVYFPCAPRSVVEATKQPPVSFTKARAAVLDLPQLAG